MKKRILGMALPIVILVGAVAAQGATSEEGENASVTYDQARADYENALDSFKACVEAAGLEVDLILEDNQVFYSLSYGSPGVSSLEVREELDGNRDLVHETCSSPQLLEAVSRLQEIVTPSEERLRDIAKGCAADHGIEITSAELDQIETAPPADADLVSCVQTRVSEDVKTRFGTGQNQ